MNHSGEKKVMGKKAESPPKILVEGFWMSFHLEPLKVPQMHYGLWVFAYSIWTFHEIHNTPLFCLANTFQFFKSQREWHLLLCPTMSCELSFPVFLVHQLLYSVYIYWTLNRLPGFVLYTRKTSADKASHHGASSLWDGGQFTINYVQHHEALWR